MYRSKKYQVSRTQDGGITESVAKEECKQGREINEVFKEVYTFLPLSHAILGGRGEVNHFFSIISETGRSALK